MPNAINSVADELRKLSELKNDGILSDDEFQQQKQKILSN
ncbi:SHOCT domain-containing protein [Heyndrickxia shackletonii]|nr:SHOCT domain-containing protein [Heyndrickxia shackletonii]